MTPGRPPVMLQHAGALPPVVRPILQTHVQVLRAALGDELVGVYVHGSIALGGFNPEQSDLDYLAVVAGPITATARAALASNFLAVFDTPGAAGGVEMSIVQARYAGPDFRYPTPYEFHMGTRDQVRLHGKPHSREYLDPDLAAHFTITQRHGLCVYGAPVDAVFATVPRAAYLASIALDAADSNHNIQTQTAPGPCRVPKYAVLNFCRVLAVIEEDRITSKRDGGAWGLAHLPPRFHPLITAALDESRSLGASPLVDGDLLKEFAAWALARIQAALDT